MKKIVICGASGFVGSSLVTYFNTKNHNVITIHRDDLSNMDKLINKLNNCDVLINLSGANIMGRWTDSYKKLLYSSRIDTTKALVQALKKCTKAPSLFISTSAIGIYKNDMPYDETTENLNNDFLANLCKDWEKEALNVNAIDTRVAIFRFGVVLGKEGGALSKMLLPFKLGLGGTIGNGEQSFSFIHIDDLVSAYQFLIDNDTLFGIFNLCSEQPTTNRGLTKALGKSLNRPTILPVPQFVLNLLLSEGASILTDGQKVLPKNLLKNGFKFQYTSIEDAIESLV